MVSQLVNSAKEKPSAAAGIVLIATGFTVLAAPAIVSAPALMVSGFGSTGVGAGKLCFFRYNSV